MCSRLFVIGAARLLLLVGFSSFFSIRCMYLCVRVEARGQRWCLLSHPLPSFLRQSQIPSSPIWLELMVSKLPGCPCLRPSLPALSLQPWPLCPALHMGLGPWTQVLVLARQALYHLRSPQLHLFFFYPSKHYLLSTNGLPIWCSHFWSGSPVGG